MNVDLKYDLYESMIDVCWLDDCIKLKQISKIQSKVYVLTLATLAFRIKKKKPCIMHCSNAMQFNDSHHLNNSLMTIICYVHFLCISIGAPNL